MLGLVLVLGGLAIAAPILALRLAALLGLAVSGGVFVWQAGHTVDDYVRDLEHVQYGREVSGRVRVEVESDVGYDPGSRRGERALPRVRRRVGGESPGPGNEGEEGSSP